MLIIILSSLKCLVSVRPALGTERCWTFCFWLGGERL